ncbi:MAG TPA: SMC-Scp complex subunit ScpB [Candidatus Thermoplasmatota archaeon]|nr:SMC-Scp complex subunit ScpB [Candidatus Thermoplasmatota archaeon]
MTHAPDGTPIEVQRNFGKPTRAQELARALAEARKAKGRGEVRAEAPAAAGLPRRPQPEPEEQAPAAPAETAPEPARPLQAGKLPNAVHASRKPMQVRFTGMKPMHVVEAALFAAGKPVAVEEMAAQTGLPPDEVRKGLAELQEVYRTRDTVLEVGKAGAKWAMQVRSQAAEPAAKFAPMEIAPKLLKTLALIAYHQPMKQSELVDMMGSKVYDHIPELVQRGLVRAREAGATKLLVTTPLFPEYFGLDASDPQEIRALMGRLVGIATPPRPKEPETVYEEPPAAAEARQDTPAA